MAVLLLLVLLRLLLDRRHGLHVLGPGARVVPLRRGCGGVCHRTRRRLAVLGRATAPRPLRGLLAGRHMHLLGTVAAARPRAVLCGVCQKGAPRGLGCAQVLPAPVLARGAVGLPAAPPAPRLRRVAAAAVAAAARRHRAGGLAVVGLLVEGVVVVLLLRGVAVVLVLLLVALVGVGQPAVGLLGWWPRVFSVVIISVSRTRQKAPLQRFQRLRSIRDGVTDPTPPQHAAQPAVLTRRPRLRQAAAPRPRPAPTRCAPTRRPPCRPSLGASWPRRGRALTWARREGVPRGGEIAARARARVSGRCGRPRWSARCRVSPLV